jgi:hypothetical protein
MDHSVGELVSFQAVSYFPFIGPLNRLWCRWISEFLGRYLFSFYRVPKWTIDAALQDIFSCFVKLLIKRRIIICKESSFRACERTGLSTIKGSQCLWMWPFLGAKSTSILDCVGWSVRRSVPHDAITWKTSYVPITSRRGGGGGNWLRRDSITSRFHYVAIPLHLGIRRSPCFIKYITKSITSEYTIHVTCKTHNV